MRNYLTACRDWQAPVLVASMAKYCQPFRLFVLAWDWEPPVAQIGVIGEVEVSYVTRAQFLAAHPEQEHIPGPPRQTINLIDTARWRLAADLVASYGPLTYVDGDQWFWSSPEPVYREIGDARMAVSPHRIPPAAMGLPGVTLETHRKYGLYNSGFVYFADAALADELARACYVWSYCHTIPQGDGTHLFGDQGHLELLAKRAGAHVIQHPGLNVAPWNVHRHDIAPGDPPMVDVYHPLITYHYSSLTPTQLAGAEYAINATQAGTLYVPYLQALDRSGR